MNDKERLNAYLRQHDAAECEARLEAESAEIARKKAPFHKGVNRVFTIRSLNT